MNKYKDDVGPRQVDDIATIEGTVEVDLLIHNRCGLNQFYLQLLVHRVSAISFHSYRIYLYFKNKIDHTHPTPALISLIRVLELYLLVQFIIVSYIIMLPE